jgi:hypothetical protein
VDIRAKAARMVHRDRFQRSNAPWRAHVDSRWP